MSAIQLLLFPETSEDKLRREIREMRTDCDKMQKSMDKQRKSLFAKNGELKKLVLDIYHRLDIIERNICQKTPEA